MPILEVSVTSLSGAAGIAYPMHCPMTRSDLSLALRRIGGDLVASQEVYDCCGVAWIVEHGVGSNVLQRIGCVATCPN